MHDVRLAIRNLCATPVVSVVAILSLALGIGANTGVFSLVDSLLLRRLPIGEPDRLVLLTTGARDDAQQFSNSVVDRIREYATDFDGVCAWSFPGKGTLGAGPDALSVDRQFVSGDYFGTLAVRPVRGRLLVPADDVRGGGPDGVVAVISYAFWQRQFVGSSNAVGAHVILDHVPVTIVGVAPPGFSGVIVGRSFDIALPVRSQPTIMASTPYPDAGPWLRVMLRLRAGQSHQQATTAIRAVQPAIRAASLPAGARDPGDFLKAPFELEAATRGVSPLRDQFARPLLVLLGIAGLVLAIASANMANLMLARGAARRHEMAVRLALGASRWRLACLLLVESAVIATAGAALALAFSSWVGQAIIANVSTFMMPIDLRVTTDWRLLLFTAVMLIAATCLFGVVPAFRAAAVAPASVIQSSDRQRGSGSGDLRLSNSLIVVQVAVSLSLIVAAGLLVRSFERLSTAPLGFDRDRTIVVTVGSPSVPAAERSGFYRRLVAAARAVPGVAAAGGSMNPPITGMLIGNFVVSPPGVLAPPGARVFSQSDEVTPGFVAAYGLTLRAGRDFTDRDMTAGQNAIIVNDAFVRQFLDASDPIGRTLDLTYRMTAQRDFRLGTRRIVGVVGDSVFRRIRDGARPTMYLPFAQGDGPILHTDFYVAVRAAAGTPMTLAREVSAALVALNPELTLTVRPMGEQLDAALAQDRLVAALAAFFGLLGVVLAALGLFGMTAYSVARRRREIAIRLALGASRGGILAMVMSRVGAILVFGTAAGFGGTLVTTRVVASLLYGVDARDPDTFVFTALTLAAACGLAAYVPALRASRAEPAAILREG
jgi:predicted permease